MNWGEPWTDKRDAQLRKLRERGFSSYQIAVELGGVTRNAVIGRAMRLGLDKRRSGGRRGKGKHKPLPTMLTSKDRGAFMQALDAVEPAAELVALTRTAGQSDNPVALLDLEPHHCRWPVRDAPYLFCADTKQDGSSYCGRHFDISRRGVATGP